MSKKRFKDEGICPVCGAKVEIAGAIGDLYMEIGMMEKYGHSYYWDCIKCGWGVGQAVGEDYWGFYGRLAGVLKRE